VSRRDLKDVEHTVELTAESLYDWVHGAFRQNDWVNDMGRGQTGSEADLQQTTCSFRENCLVPMGFVSTQTKNRNARR
jgi:hypothetical protein